MLRRTALIFSLIVAGSSSIVLAGPDDKSGENVRIHEAPEAPRGKKRPSIDEGWKTRKPPSVTRIDPMSGAPGTEVTIHGDNFDQTTKVRFNGRPLRVLSFTPTTLRVIIPPNGVSDTIVVDKPGFPAITGPQFDVIRTPIVTTFSPPRGDVGITVTIYGQHFLSTDKIFIGDMETTMVTIATQRAMVKIPTGAKTSHFRVMRQGQSVAQSRQMFEVNLPPPTISGFVPQSGEKGTTVRLSGQHFDTTDQLYLGRARLVIRERSDSHLVAVIDGETGPFELRGKGGRIARTSAEFTVIRPPTVIGFSPRAGSPGTRVTIEGSGFLSTDQAMLGKAFLTIRTISDRQIVAELPAGVQTAQIIVKRGTNRYGAPGKFEVVYAPNIVGIEPLTGVPGTSVVIRGDYFTPDINAMLAGQRIAIRQKKLPSELVVTIPPDAKTGQFVVINNAGSSTYPQTFHVLHPAIVTGFAPLQGLPGTSVTLTGSNFSPETKVFLGTMELRPTSISDQSFVVTIPEGATTNRFNIESYGRKSTTRMMFTVLKPEPEISFTVNPSRARRGSEVTLTLTPPQTSDIGVFFEGRPLPKRILDGGRSVIVTIPGDAQSGYFELEFKGKRYRASQRTIVF